MDALWDRGWGCSGDGSTVTFVFSLSSPPLDVADRRCRLRELKTFLSFEARRLPSFLSRGIVSLLFA